MNKRGLKIGDNVYSPMCGYAVITNIFKSIKEDSEELVYEIREKNDFATLETKYLVFDDELCHELDYDPTP